MYMTFRWFGSADPVTLPYIRQIPGVEGIVSALHEVPAGEPWPKDALTRHAEKIDAAGFRFSVVESVPVHEDIKLGRPTRDRLIDHYCLTIRRIGELGIPVLCYNFMPVFDWMRTTLDRRLDDGSFTLAYDHADLGHFDLARGLAGLPAWASAYEGPELAALLAAYRDVHEEQLWEHLGYFLERIVPVAAEVGVKLAIHPDDPPWSIFGLPRIITDAAALARLVALVDHNANGVTFCTGSFGALPANDLPAMIHSLGARVHFAHCRNVRVTGDRRFYETPHPSRFGSVDMPNVLRALRDVGFSGPMRPDHGRMIWGEVGRPGYGLYDRALGAMYLQGLWEALADEPVAPQSFARASR
jgi:mannonate dehydratase